MSGTNRQDLEIVDICNNTVKWRASNSAGLILKTIVHTNLIFIKGLVSGLLESIAECVISWLNVSKCKRCDRHFTGMECAARNTALISALLQNEKPAGVPFSASDL